MDDIKLLAKDVKGLNIFIQTIKREYRNGICRKKMRHAYNERRKITINAMNKTTKSRKNQNAWRKGNLQLVGKVGTGHHQTSEDERNSFKNILDERENYSKVKSIAGILSKG